MRRPLIFTLIAISAAAAALWPRAAAAQRLRDQISSLFIFGSGKDPLFLAGSGDPDNPASLQAHGSHFIPASQAENASLIAFITDAISSNVANTPIGSTSGGETFRFEGGVPVRTSTSAGPIFAERAQTLGRGRMLVGLSRSSFHFRSLRGVDLDDIDLKFTHQNSDFPGCDTVFAGDCSQYGVPSFENDLIDFRLSLDIDVDVSSFYVTYGLTDRLDVSAVVPVVHTVMHGQSEAQIQPFGPGNIAHFFAGTASEPVLSATRATNGQATGLGDAAVRVKASLHESTASAFSLLGEARFATGDEEDLLGSGEFAARGLAIFTARMGDFSPHVNVGYLFRGGETQNDALLATGGFDQRMSDRVTLAADLVTELQVGTSKLRLPPPVTYDAPFVRTIRPTSIPDIRDDLVNGSFGFKFVPSRGVTAIVNALFPLNQGGLRPDIIYTAALEYAF
jgi:hypothetical protein